MGETLIIVLALILVYTFAKAGLSIAPWIPARKNDLARINRLASLKPGQSFVELGCGGGRICRYIARHNPGAKVTGIEILWPFFLWAKVIGFASGLENMEIKYGDAYQQDLGEADVVYVFATERTINADLKDKFLRELKKGAKVLSYVFPIFVWPGKSSKDKPDENYLAIYIYGL
jgi:SAM-dependent methyltransferase